MQRIGHLCRHFRKTVLIVRTGATSSGEQFGSRRRALSQQQQGATSHRPIDTQTRSRHRAGNALPKNERHRSRSSGNSGILQRSNMRRILLSATSIVQRRSRNQQQKAVDLSKSPSGLPDRGANPVDSVINLSRINYWTKTMTSPPLSTSTATTCPISTLLLFRTF